MWLLSVGLKALKEFLRETSTNRVFFECNVGFQLKFVTNSFQFDRSIPLEVEKEVQTHS